MAECTEKTTREEQGPGYVGAAHTPTYPGPPLAVDLFSVDSWLLRLEIWGFGLRTCVWRSTLPAVRSRFMLLCTCRGGLQRELNR